LPRLRRAIEDIRAERHARPTQAGVQRTLATIAAGIVPS
jgi:hypothetical protein